METIIPFIGCYDRQTDILPESHSQWLDSISDVEGRIEVGVAGVPASAMKEACGSDSDISTSRTGLACISRVYFDNDNAFFYCFVFHKGLQLCECPAMQLPVESPAFIPADMLYVFHSENIAISKSFNNLLANFVIFASHEPRPSTRQSFEMSLGRFRAFALQGRYKSLMLSHLRNDTAKEFAARSNGKMLYSDINAQNSPMSSRAKRHVNVFGNTEMKEYSVLLVYGQDAFPNIPVVILGSILWYFYMELLATMNSSNAEDSILIGEASWRIVSHESSLNYGFVLGFLNHATSLFDTGTSELGMETKRTDMSIDKWLQSVSVLDSVLPSGVYTVLECILINRNSFAHRFIIRQFQTNYSTRHNQFNDRKLFKHEIPPITKEDGLPFVHDW